jgi:DNA gyrase inhibitor
MNIKVEIIPSYPIAYIRRVGPYGTENVQTMESLKSWAKSKNLFTDETIILGIALDNPETTKPENCRYDTCIVISDNYCINDEYVRQGKIAEGKYAVFQIDHTAEAVRQAWLEIFADLLKKDYQLDETRPIIERYIVKMVRNHYCEICVPIK